MNKAILAMAIAATLPAVAAPRVLRLAEGDEHQRRVITNSIELAEGVQRSWVTVTRTGKFHDRRYGDFEITTAMLSQMVRNFDAGVVGTDIFLDVSHKPEDGSAAKVLSLKVDGGRLRAQVEWTPYGTNAVREKGYCYLSAEFDEDWHDNEQKKAHGCTLLGAGLTNRPVIKRLDPVTLAVADDPEFSGPVFVHPGLVQQLTQSLETTLMNRWKKYLAQLEAAGIKLSDAALQSLKAAFDAATKHLTEDADDAEVLKQFEGVAKALAESGASTVQLSVNAPGAAPDAKMLSDAIATALNARDSANKKLADDLTAARKVYTDTLAASKALSEDTRTQLAEGAQMINGNWTADQVTAFAEQQVKIGERLESARQLSALGYQAGGVVQISVDDSNAIKQLAQTVHERLKLSAEHAAGDLKLLDDDKLPAFARVYLAEFDRANAHALHREAKILAGGPVDTADTKLPATFEREVIREALSDLNILSLIDARVEPTTGATHTIPFETRDLTDVRNDGVTFEGQPIRYGGIKQDNEFAYIQPVKLAMNLTNEVIFFSQNNPNINWDAWARVSASNARAVRELTARRIANHLQHCSDSYGAIAVTGVTLTEATGGGGVYKAANFPIVRPYQPRDLKGNAVGTAENLLVVKVSAAAIAEYDGTGTQATGNYYRVLNWNLGLVQVVDKLGAGVEDLTVTADHSYATNVAKFDIDVVGSETQEKRLNGLLRAVGERKAMLNSERFSAANAALMSPTLNDLASNAEQFTYAAARADASVSAVGDLLPIKGIPVWSTNAPNLDLGDDRIQLLERGLLRYRVAKTFSTGAPFEAIDPATGRPIGRKVAYGEEYSSIHVPGPLRRNLTSVIVYSADARTAI